MRRILLAVIMLLAMASTAWADGQYGITSETMHQNGEAYEFEGSVYMTQGDSYMLADAMLFTKEPDKLDAKGNFVYEDKFVLIKAGRAVIDLQTNTGTIYDALVFIKQEKVTIKGIVIHKGPNDTYKIDSATATTCTDPQPAWCLEAHDIDVTINGWLTAHDTKLIADGVPVLYTPYMIAPVLKDRQSGFLSPSIGYSSDKGFLYSQPYFWAISDNRDATIAVDAYGKRGIGIDLEHRYVMQSGLNGNLNFYGIADSKTDDTYTRTDSWHRWGDSFMHVNMVNHNDFYRIFADRRDERTARYLQSDAETSMWSGPVRLYAAASIYQDLLEDSRDTEVVNRLPELGAYMKPQELGPVLLSTGAGAVNFEQEDGARGQRYESWARIYHSMGLGLVLSQEAEGRAYAYELQDNGEGHKEEDVAAIGSYAATLAATYARSYEGGMRHFIEPSLQYKLAGRTGDDVPMFDYEDTVGDSSTLSFAVMNRLKFSNREIDVLITQPYDFRDQNGSFAPLELSASYWHQKQDYMSMSIKYDHAAGEVSSAAVVAKLAYDLFTVNFSESYDLASDIATHKLGFEYAPNGTMTLKSGVSFDKEYTNRPEEVYATVDYHTQCWGFVLTTSYHNEEFSVRLTINLFGLGSYTVK